jgi:hypothetical protein
MPASYDQSGSFCTFQKLESNVQGNHGRVPACCYCDFPSFWIESKERTIDLQYKMSDAKPDYTIRYTPPAYQTNMGDSPRASRPHRKRRSPRHKSWYQEGVPINVHVGNRRSPGYQTCIQVNSGDGSRFAALVHETLRANPEDPLLMYTYSTWS